MIPRVMLALEPAATRSRVRSILSKADVLLDGVEQTEQLLAAVGREAYDVIVVSPPLLGSSPEITIDSFRGLPDPPEIVVLMTAGDDAEAQAKFLAAGCLSVLSAELPAEALREALWTVVQRSRERVEQRLTPRRAFPNPRISDFSLQSPAMQQFVGVVRRVVSSDTSLLITGETGVGKERLARAIHAESPRSRGPFVAVNCGALPDALLESELFGHEEGAFTGATRSRRGWFELAHRGTLFLDEIGEMAPHLQVKLLHVLEDNEIKRVGAESSIRIDVRVMAATNRNLAEAMDNGGFRRDVYYRLSVVSLHIPPLRQRREDIPGLIDSFVGHFRKQIPTNVRGVTEQARAALMDYSWPGNVRELVNVIERALLLCEGHNISPADLPSNITPNDPDELSAGRPSPHEWLEFASPPVPDEWLGKPLRELRRQLIASFERAYLAGLLQSTGGRIGETARHAGIEPRSLYEKMRRYQLRKEDYRRREKF